MTTAGPMPGQERIPQTSAELSSIVRSIGEAAAPHAARHDREASFVAEGYEAIRACGYGLIAVPRELGGAGFDLAAVCQAEAVLARYCANTALAIAMHQHTVLSLAWRWRLGDRAVEHTLRRIARGELILSSSGTADLDNPGITAEPVDGGLLVSGRKRFCSGVPGADVIATIARVDDGERGSTATVLIPTSDPGTKVIPDWDAMGMRGSGSNSVSFSEVLVPDANVLQFGPRVSSPRRYRHGEPNAHSPATPHPGDTNGSERLPALHVALAVIASVYLGSAGAMRDKALSIAATQTAPDPVRQRIAGEMTAEFRSGRWALDALLAQTTDFSLGSEDQFITTMLAKRQVVLSAIRVVELSMELLGSRSYLRDLPFEQALRDVRAGITHPLPPERTLIEVGVSALRYFASSATEVPAR